MKLKYSSVQQPELVGFWLFEANNDLEIEEVVGHGDVVNWDNNENNGNILLLSVVFENCWSNYYWS